MSEGILTLVPVPTKNDKSLDSATINFEFPTLNSKQLIQILCSESDFLAMGLKSKYLLRLSHLKSTRLNLVMLGQKKILASYFLPLLSMHLVLNFPNFPVCRLFKWSDNWSFLWLAYLQLFPNLSNRSHTNFLSLLSTCFLSLCLFSHFLGTVSLQRSQVTCSPFR